MRNIIPHRHRTSGAALVITLGVLGLAVLLVVGLAISMRTEQIAASAFSQRGLAQQLAASAIDEAIFLLRTNTPVFRADNIYDSYWISRPGQIIRHGPSPDDRLFSIAVPLSSAGTINLNLDDSIIASNSIYAAISNRQIFVDWVTVGTNGSAAGAGNPIIGRYAYWVDDEASKININTARYRQNTSASTNGASMSDVDLRALSGVGAAIADNTWNFAQTNGFFTTEHWKSTLHVGATTYEQNKFFITAHSLDMDFTPWGTKRKNLNDPTNGLTRSDIDNPETTLANPALGAWFRYTSGGQIITNTFQRKYRTEYLKQILANMFEFRRPDGLESVDCAGSEPHNLNTTNAPGLKDVPRYYLGLRRHPLLNEIGVRVGYCWTNTSCGAAIQANAYIFIELVNPYDQAWTNGGQVRVVMDQLRFRVVGDNGAWSYVTGPSTDWSTAWQTLGPGGNCGYQSTNEHVVDVPVIPANSYAVVQVAAFAGQKELNPTAFVDHIGVRIAKVRFLLSYTNNVHTIRDWAIVKDFDEQLCDIPGVSSNQFCFSAPNGGEPIPLMTDCPATVAINNPYTRGVAKNDPRVRRFTDWDPPPSARPWYHVGWGTTTNATLGTENTGVVNFTGGDAGFVNVPKDPSETGINLVDHSTFPPFPARDYESVGELGYIHTGLQWRTLWMLPESNTASNYIPDWAVLDMFSITNAAVAGRINLNGATTTHLTGAAMPLRLPAITALGTNLNLAGVAPLPVLNIATQNFDIAFTSRYYAANFFTNAYTMIGQICEVAGLTGSSGTPKAQREGWVRALANLITVRSEQFTIWAIGQAIQDINNNGTYDPGVDLIVGEAKARAIVSRIQSPGSDGLWGTADDTVEYRCLEFKYLTN